MAEPLDDGGKDAEEFARNFRRAWFAAVAALRRMRNRTQATVDGRAVEAEVLPPEEGRDG